MTETTTEKPLYTRIKDTIEDEIHRGLWQPGQRIYSEKDICGRFGVSRITAIRVLNELRQDNYVRRERGRGRGSILTSTEGRSTTRPICLMLRTSGHFYAPFFHRLLGQFEPSDYQVLTFPFGTVQDEQLLRRRWQQMLLLSPRAIIVDAKREAPFFLLENAPPGTSFVFMLDYERVQPLPGGYVLADYREGGRRAARHALRCGYKRILCYTSPLAPWNRGQQARIDGIRQTCAREGVACAVLERKSIISGHVSQEQEDVGSIAATLAAAGKGTAVLCDYDARCLAFFKAAERIGWSVPDDAGIIGYFNTPLGEAHEITSVDAHSEEVARVTVDFLKRKRTDTVVTPEVIERTSTRRGR